MRATISKGEYPFFVYVDDDVTVGTGTEKSCTELMDELNASDHKCDLLKKIMTEKQQKRR